EARRKAGLSERVTRTACRHGGMSQLGDPALTEAQTLALSRHKTPDAGRLYAERTDTQRVAARRTGRPRHEAERRRDEVQIGGDQPSLFAFQCYWSASCLVAR